MSRGGDRNVRKKMQIDTNEAKLQHQKWDSRHVPTDQAPFMCPW